MMMRRAGTFKYMAEMHEKFYEEAKAAGNAPLARHHKKAAVRNMKEFEEWNKNPHAR